MTIQDIGVDPIPNNILAYDNMKMIRFGAPSTKEIFLLS